MKYIKLFESYLIKESENTNLEMKSIFKKLIYELRKMGLEVKFEYKKFNSVDDFMKFIPSKNYYESDHDVYLVMNDDNKDYNSHMKLFFNKKIDEGKSKSYLSNVKSFIDKNYGDKLETNVSKSLFGEVMLYIKPLSTINKSQYELSMDANKFMGLKRTPLKNGISYLVGSGWEYVSKNIEKNREMILILIDDNKKIVKLMPQQTFIDSSSKEKLIKIAKRFAKENDYKYQ